MLACEDLLYAVIPTADLSGVQAQKASPVSKRNVPPNKTVSKRNVSQLRKAERSLQAAGTCSLLRRRVGGRVGFLASYPAPAVSPHSLLGQADMIKVSDLRISTWTSCQESE